MNFVIQEGSRGYPELVVMSRGTLLNESTVVGGYVSVVGVLLKHIDLQFNFLLFILYIQD